MGKGPKQTLLQRGHTEHPETHEGMLDIASHQRDANKTTIRYYFTPVRVANINKQMLKRMWRKGNPSTFLVEIQTGIVTVENSMEFPQKAEN